MRLSLNVEVDDPEKAIDKGQWSPAPTLDSQLNYVGLVGRVTKFYSYSNNIFKYIHICI